MPLVGDDSLWPVVVETVSGKPTDEDIRGFNARRAERLSRAEQHVQVMDVCSGMRMSSRHRRMIAEFDTQHRKEQERYLAGVALAPVRDSLIGVRGGHQATMYPGIRNSARKSDGLRRVWRLNMRAKWLGSLKPVRSMISETVSDVSRRSRVAIWTRSWITYCPTLIPVPFLNRDWRVVRLVAKVFANPSTEISSWQCATKWATRGRREWSEVEAEAQGMIWMRGTSGGADSRAEKSWSSMSRIWMK
jgi:hypothetical protein